MDVQQIISQSFLSNMDIQDSDLSVDGKTFLDAKEAVAKAINTIAEALPKMKESGIDMKKASVDAEGLFRSLIRKEWGGNEIDFYVTKDGNKSIVGVTQRSIDDIVNQVVSIVANY